MKVNGDIGQRERVGFDAFELVERVVDGLNQSLLQF